jgi:hypothetical protein
MKNKEMKVIDLLNKIANNEIKLETKFNWHYKWKDITLLFTKRCGALGLFFEDGKLPDGDPNYIGLFERFNCQILNDEVEIIDETDVEFEDIEEMEEYSCQGLEVAGYSMTQAEYLLDGGIRDNRDVINQLIRNQKKIIERLNGDDNE